jgi:hypothetical protein
MDNSENKAIQNSANIKTHIMKLRFLPSIVAVLTYLLCLMVFYQDEAASDGYTLIGFPFYFYTNSGGKFEAGYRPHFGFNIINFLLDLFLLCLMLIVFNYLYSIMAKRKHA